MPGIIGLTRRPTRREWRRAVITGVLGLVGLFLVILLVHPSQPPLLADGTGAPSIVLASDTGRRLDVLALAALHPVVVEFFETSCVSCEQDAEPLCAVSNAFPDVTVVAVGAGGEAAPALRAFEAKYLQPPCRVTVLVDPGRTVAHAYQAAVVPTVYVIDRSGHIAYGGVGVAGIHGVAAMLHQLHA